MDKAGKILKHQQLHKLIVYGFGQLFNLVTPLLVVPYIVEICGEENYGKIAVGMGISFFLIVFIDYGVDLVGVREISVNRDNPEALKRIIVKSYAARFIILLIILLLASALFSVIPFFAHEKKLYFLCIAILVGQYLNPTWFLQGIENVRWITFSNIISKILYLSGVFVFINTAADYIYVNLLWGGGMIIANGLFLFLIMKQYQVRFHQVKSSDIKDFIRRDFSMFSSQIFVAIQLNAPVILISFFGNNLMAGQYKIIEQIIVIFKTYILLFFNFVFPKICYLLEFNRRKAFINWGIYNSANFIFVVLGMSLIYLFSHEIIAYFNAANINALSNLLHAAILIPLLMAISVPLKQLVLGWNFKKMYVYITSVLVLINLLVIILLLPHYQVYGVFYSLIAYELIMIIAYSAVIRKKVME